MADTHPGMGSSSGDMFSVDAGNLTAVSKGLKQITDDVTKLDNAVKKLSENLTKMAGMTGKSFGVQTSGPGTNLSTATISAGFSSLGGGNSGPGFLPSFLSGMSGSLIGGSAMSANRSSGSTMTLAPISFGGGGGGPPTPGGGGGGGGGMSPDRALKTYAVGQMAAQAAGWVKNKVSTITDATVSSDLLYRQNATAYGTSVGRETNVLQGMKGLNATDMTQAGYMMQANPFLSGPGGGARSNGAVGFSNAMQGLNPLMGASGGMAFANTLTSSQFLNFAARSGIGMTGGGLLNVKTGQLNAPGQTMRTTAEMIAVDPHMTAKKAKDIAGNAQSWMQFTMNAQAAGITDPQQIQALKDYMGNGMNMSSKAIKGSVAASQAAKGTAQGHRDLTFGENTVSFQNAVNKFGEFVARFEHSLMTIPGLGTAGSQLLLGGATLAGGALAAGAVVAKGASIFGGVAKFGAKVFTSGAKAAGRAAGTAATDVIDTTATVATDAGGAVSSAGGAGWRGAAAVAGRGALAAGRAAAFTNPEMIAAAASDILLPMKNGMTMGQVTRGARKNPNAPLDIGAYGGDDPDQKKHLEADLKKYRMKVPTTYGGWDAYNKKWDATYEADKNMGDPGTGSTTTGGMQPNLARSINAMKRDNPNIKISSGHRTSSQQANLFALKGGQGVAKPGHSAHQTGRAADIGPASQFGWIAQNAHKYGLYTPDSKSEPWHVQTMGDPVSSPVSGLTAGRIDQGVDYSGSGTVNAAGSGTIVRVQTSGWGSMGNAGIGACIVLKLDNPPDAQHTMIYYAENIIPSVKVGQHVNAGEVIGKATGTGSGIEIGWGDQNGNPSAPLVKGNEGGTTSAGKNFSDWLKGASVSSASSTGAASSTASSTVSAIGGGSSVGTSLASSFISKVGGSWLSGSGLAMLGSGGKSSGSQSQSGSSGVGGTGSTTAVGGAVADNSIKTPTQFSLAVLRGLGVSPSTADVLAINEWQQHEGQWTVRGGDNPYYAPNMHDPLNTKLPMPGSVDLGGETRSYKTWADGVSASVSTIKQKNMSAILTALKGNADLKTFGAALESTPWAASSYGGADFAKPSGVYAMGDPSGSSLMAPAPSMRHSSGTVLPGARGGGGTINLSMPIQMVNGSQQDATRLVSMVVQELQKQTGMSAVSGS